MAARVIRCLSCREGRLYHGGKRASMSIVAASFDWQHCPAGMPWVCGRFLDRGLWSCPGCLCGHLLGLWSSPESVFISWLLVCGHALGLW